MESCSVLMKGRLVVLVTLVFLACQIDKRIIEDETFYEAVVNGEFVRNSDVTYRSSKSDSKVVINCRHFSVEGFLRRTITFESVAKKLHIKEPLFKDQWGLNDHDSAVVFLTTWQSDGDVYGETYNLINKDEAWITLTKYEDDFIEGEASFTLAFDNTYSFGKDRVYPDIPDTLEYQDFRFRAYFL